MQHKSDIYTINNSAPPSYEQSQLHSSNIPFYSTHNPRDVSTASNQQGQAGNTPSEPNIIIMEPAEVNKRKFK